MTFKRESMSQADSETIPAPSKSRSWARPRLVLAGFAIFDWLMSLAVDPVRPHDAPQFLHLAILAVVSSQLTLLAQWFALADQRWSSRLLLVAAGLGLLTAIGARLPMLRDLMPTLLAVFVPQVASLLLARWGGWRIQRGVATERRLGAWQFSLWQGIVTLTAFSILFGTVRFVRSWQSFDHEWTLFLAINLALTICSLRAGMGIGSAGLRIPPAIIVGNLLCAGLIAIVIISQGSRIDSIHWWTVAVIVNLQLLLIVGPLLVLRRFGYRFERMGGG